MSKKKINNPNRGGWQGGMHPVWIIMLCNTHAHMTEHGWVTPPWVESLHQKIIQYQREIQ